MRFTITQKQRINHLYQVIVLDSNDWDESKHPRKKNGQFGKGGGNQKIEQKPKEGAFGKIYTEFKHNAQGAIKKLISVKGGEAIAALSHSEIGDIDLIWGEEGNPNNGYEGGYGLAKIVAKHPEVLSDLQGILDKMKVNPERSGSNRLRMQSEDGRYRAVVRLNWEGKEKKWLLTAFEKGRNNNVTEKRTDTSSFSNTGDTALCINAVDEIIDQHIFKYQLKIRVNCLQQRLDNLYKRTLQ